MEAVGYPIFSGKHDHESLITPEAVVGKFRENYPDRPIPDGVILTYGRGILRELERRGVPRSDGYPVGVWGGLWFVESEGRSVAVAGGFGLGAPAAVIVLEEMIQLGVREFISIGAAGCLQPHCEFGEVVVCTSAIRDEGVSHHYEPTTRFAYPSPTLTARLAAVLERDGVPPTQGPTWTVDAIYRETTAEARAYQTEGVVCVEMEAAALFTVAKYRGADLAAGFAVSDHLLAEDRWTNAFGSDELREGQLRLLDAAIQTLCSS